MKRGAVGHIGRLTRGKWGGAPPLLDALGVAPVGAWSIRKLTSAYAGAALRVRRSSDSAEQDIGFSGGWLDTAALLAFVGAGDGFVVSWYDQSGNGRNLNQATTANQPKIVASGAYLNGVKPDAASVQRVAATNAAFAIAASAVTVSSVLAASTLGGSALGAVWFAGSASGARIWLGAGVSSRDLTIRNAANAAASPTQTMLSGGNVITFTKTATANISSCQTRLNGSAASSYAAAALSATDNLFGINQNGNGSACGDHTHRELILFGSVLDAGQIAILERDQSAAFGVPLA